MFKRLRLIWYKLYSELSIRITSLGFNLDICRVSSDPIEPPAPVIRTLRPLIWRRTRSIFISLTERPIKSEASNGDNFNPLPLSALDIGAPISAATFSSSST